MDIFNSVFGDAYTRQMLLGIGLLIILSILWLVWKFFFAFFKHVLLALFLAALGSTVYFYLMNRTPPKDPNIGKYAYGTSSGRFLGVIETATDDSYVVKSGNAQIKYPKGRVIVKDKMDPIAVEAPSPSPSVKPKPAHPSKKAAH